MKDYIDETINSVLKQLLSEKRKKPKKNKNAIKIVSLNKSNKNALKNKIDAVWPVLSATYDNGTGTYSLTRSQLAYELYPSLDKDSARSKLSQKILGNKSFTISEVNKLFNIITGDLG